MLSELRVRDLAVIQDARLELVGGLNVLTGETGAGKSMLVDALALLLGERADAALVRPGAERAVVEGAFDVDERGGLTGDLAELGVEPEEGRLVLKREVASGGRSRAWANGSPVTVGVLAEIGRRLVDLHGQHETQSLLRPEAQREILDLFADAGAEAAAVRATWDHCERLAAEQRQLQERQADARRRADYLKHVSEEIERAKPKPGELEQVEAEARRLEHAEELGRLADEIAQLLGGDDRSAASALGHVSRLLASLERIDPEGAASWRGMLDAAVLNVEELARSLDGYREGVDLDPARLQAVERRRDALAQLDRKYGPGIERVIAAGEEARRELGLLDTADTDLSALARRLEEARRELAEKCRALTAKRSAAAKKLARAVTAQLGALGMPDGRFRVGLSPVEPPSRFGAEAVEFLVQLNPGMDERSLARSASGGELSRIMLALKAELARHDAVPTLVFDEVDQGVGGHVGGRVAAALASAAASHQVLVITHLPQVAAAAARHLVVTKAAADGAAQVDVREVRGGDRVEEVAKMLGGDASLETARRHAAQLLRKAPPAGARA